MLLPDWKRKLDLAAYEGRELRTQSRRNGHYRIIAVCPGMDEMIVVDDVEPRQFVKVSKEIQTYYSAVGGTV